MPLVFGTEHWARALENAINASGEYGRAGGEWGVGFNGNVLLAFEADAWQPRARSLLVRLGKGACQGAEFIEGTEHGDAGFAFRAPASVWREILDGRMNAAMAILSGRMKVEGDTATLLKFMEAHRALVRCAASIATAFPE